MEGKIKKYIINRETILYLIFGIMTTIVNFGTFIICDYFIGGEYYLISNIVSFICATIFAFVTNKKFVFQSESWKLVVFLKELIFFGMSRISTFLVIEELGLFVAVEMLGVDKLKFEIIDGKLVVKMLLAFIAVLANYIISKYFVFRNKEKKDEWNKGN